MTSLMITDIRKSGCNSGLYIVTAIFICAEGHDASRLMSFAKMRRNGLLVLESAIAEEELLAIGVRRGDRFIRMWAKPDHGLRIGEEIRFERHG